MSKAKHSNYNFKRSPATGNNQSKLFSDIPTNTSVKAKSVKFVQFEEDLDSHPSTSNRSQGGYSKK